MTDQETALITITSRSELMAYLARDKITCLICKNSFVALGSHLYRKHQMTADAYRARFGIPQYYGLAGKAFRDASSRRMQQLIDTGRISTPPPNIQNERLQGHSRQPKPPVVKGEDLQKLIRLRGGKAPWVKADFEEFIKRVGEGRTVASVSKDADMPTKGTFLKYLAKHLELKAEYDRLRRAFPLDLQVATRKVGETYLETIGELRSKNLTWSEISKILKVKASTLRNAGRRIVKRGPPISGDR